MAHWARTHLTCNGHVQSLEENLGFPDPTARPGGLAHSAPAADGPRRVCAVLLSPCPSTKDPALSNGSSLELSLLCCPPPQPGYEPQAPTAPLRWPSPGLLALLARLPAPSTGCRPFSPSRLFCSVRVRATPPAASLRPQAGLALLLEPRSMPVSFPGQSSSNRPWQWGAHEPEIPRVPCPGTS